MKNPKDCPEEIVAEHRQMITSTIEREWTEETHYDIREDDIEDAEFEEKLD
jgi:hypothetical protein